MTYYHGGKPGLRVGDEILPPSVTGRTDSTASIAKSAGLEGAEHVRDDRVYLGTTPEVALLFAAMYPTKSGGWVYEVIPKGPVEPDPDYSGPSGESVQCPRATILRVVGPITADLVFRIRQLVMTP